MPAVGNKTLALVSDRTLHWAKRWDRMHHPIPVKHLPSLSLWQRLLLALDANLGCGTKSICGIVGHPVDGSIVAMALACAVVLLVAIVWRMRRVVRSSSSILALLVFWLLLHDPRPKTLPPPPLVVEHSLDVGGYNASEPPPILADAREQPAWSTGLGWDCPHSQRYVAGSIEREWLRGGRTASGNICALSNKTLAASRKHWLPFVQQVRKATLAGSTRTSLAAAAHTSGTYSPHIPVRPSHAHRSHLSRFVGGDGTTLHLIEPLTGVARHPLASGLCYKGADAVDIFDLGYLLTTNACDQFGKPAARCSSQSRGGVSAKRRLPRNLYYDLGCTVFDDDKDLGEGTGSSVGPSLPLFFQMYERNCIVFDQLFG